MTRLVVVGSGAAPYRRYALETLARTHALALVTTGPATWQHEYVDQSRVVPPGDVGAIADAVRELAGGEPVGILSWDELVVEDCARAARQLGLRSMSPEAVSACRDKLATRRLLEAAGLGSARFRHVQDASDARAAADELGYPVVIKPRSLAGSAGVVMAVDKRQVSACVLEASGARYSTLPVQTGVLVEELLDGPEVSVDLLTSATGVQVLQVSRKEVGFAPYFEEVAHVTRDYSDQDWFGPVTRLAVEANHALGIDAGVTHTEIKLTGRGPVVVEVNARLGGDLIPLIGFMARGVDQVVAAAAVALGAEPDLAPRRSGVARVEFVYPPEDARVVHLDVEGARRVPGVADVISLAAPGDVVRLPPRAVLGRLAALLVTGETEEECARTAAVARRHLVTELEPVGRPAMLSA